MKKKFISIFLALLICLTICPAAKAQKTFNINLNVGFMRYSHNEGPEEYWWGPDWANFATTYISTPTTIQINPGQARISVYFYNGNNRYCLKEYHDCTYSIGGKPTGGLKSYVNVKYPNGGPSNVIVDVTPSIITGLTPNTDYVVGSNFPYTKMRDDEYESTYVDTIDIAYRRPRHVYTEATVPIISFSNIKDKQLTINWNPNGNPSGTIYNIKRKIGNGPWSTVLSNYTGNTYTDTNLVEDTTYIYRIKVLHVAPRGWDGSGAYGTSDAIWDVYTPGQPVSTTANPAVAAAQEAASAAQAAKLAADSSLQNTQEAKTAAINVFDQVNNPE